MPLELDLQSASWPVQRADAIVAINVLHYTPWASTPALFRGAARVLSEDGIEFLVLDDHTSAVEGSIGAIPRRLMVAESSLARAKLALGNASLTIRG